MQVEVFTAESAVEAGLIEAVKSGATRITGSYELTRDGAIEFNQNEFTFVDKNGNLRCGKFKIIFRDISEITMFSALFLSSTLIEQRELNKSKNYDMVVNIGSVEK